MSKTSTVISVRIPNELLSAMPSSERSAWIVGLIRDSVGKPLKPDLEARVSALEAQIKELSTTSVNTCITKSTTPKLQPVLQGDVNEIIWEKYTEGLTPTETANWLNENGYKPARGDKFTLAGVNSIKRRLKRERE